jgi:hypothetical protein
MNDEELDLMLDAWTLARPLPSLRERVRLGFPGPPWREKMLRFVPVGIGKFVFGGGLVAAGLLLVAALGFSQPSRTAAALAGIRFTVDSESTYYEADGTPTTTEVTSYEFRGDTITLAESKPGHPLWTMAHHVANTIGFLTVQIAPSLITPEETEIEKIHHADFVRAGCVTSGETVEGYETIANYRTVKAVRHMRPLQSSGAKTLWLADWRAPDLSCYRLADTAENQFADGSVRLVVQEKALRVNLNQ